MRTCLIWQFLNDKNKQARLYFMVTLKVLIVIMNRIWWENIFLVVFKYNIRKSNVTYQLVNLHLLCTSTKMNLSQILERIRDSHELTYLILQNYEDRNYITLIFYAKILIEFNSNLRWIQLSFHLDFKRLRINKISRYHVFMDMTTYGCCNFPFHQRQHQLITIFFNPFVNF